MKECFVIMPFSATTENHTEKYWKQFYENLQDILGKFRYECKRSEAGPYNLISQIVDKIRCCDLAIAVLTDLSPNVWYELGIRHSLKNGTIMLLQKGQKIPFDISSYGVLFYDDGISVNLDLKEQINKYIKKLEVESCDSPVLDRLQNTMAIEPLNEKFDKMYELILKLTKNNNDESNKVHFKANISNRILWVDDFPSNNQLVIDIFQEKNIRFDIALNTHQAISLYKENSYDLIITDMGRGNEHDAGLKLITELNKISCNTPIVVYASSSAIRRYGAQAYELGAQAVVNCINEIVSLISRVVSNNEK